MRPWLVGSGYWGSKINQSLKDLGYDARIIDLKNGNSIDDINTKDPVILATPVWEHFKQASSLISNGYDVYIEKPAAENAQQINELLSMVNDEIVMVGHIFLYNNLIDSMKQIIESNELGDIKFIHSERTNLGIFQTKTSTLLSLAPHDFSIIDYLFNSIEITNAAGYFLSDNVQFDRVSINGNCQDIPFQIDLSWRWPLRRRILTVVGDLGQAVWNEDTKNIQITYNEINNGRMVTTNEDKFIQSAEHNNPLKNELEHFLECVKTRQQPKTDLNSAVRIAEFIDSAAAFLQK